MICIAVTYIEKQLKEGDDCSMAAQLSVYLNIHVSLEGDMHGLNSIDAYFLSHCRECFNEDLLYMLELCNCRIVALQKANSQFSPGPDQSQ